MKKSRVILLVDMDAFFASCHQSLDDSLREKKIVVCSPNLKSIITTANYNARKFGIRAGMPLFKAKQLCNDLITISSDFKLYQKISFEIFNFIKKEYTNNIEMYSIDECYIDATNIWRKYHTVKNMCDDIRKKIFNKFNLTCSVGASYNRFFAKMAVELNKPNGTTIVTKNSYKQMIWPLPIRDMFGVGISREFFFIKNNIKTIGDLANWDEKWLISELGKWGMNLFGCANGYSSDYVNTEIGKRKSISNELTLDRESSDYHELRMIIINLAERLWTRATFRNFTSKSIGIWFKEKKQRENVFVKKDAFLVKTKTKVLRNLVNSLEELEVNILELFDDLWNGEFVNCIGIGFKNLITSRIVEKQFTFDDYKNKKIDNRKTLSIIDKLNANIGSEVLVFADNLKPKPIEKFTPFEDTHLSHSQIKNKQ